MKIKIVLMLLCTGGYIAPILCMDDPQCVYLSQDVLKNIQASEEHKLNYFIERQSKNVPINELIEKNNAELKSFKKSIKQKKEEALDKFKKKYPLTDKCWENYHAGKRLVSSINKIYMARGLHDSPCVGSDNEFPIVHYVKKQLHEQNISKDCVQVSFNSVDSKENSVHYTLVKVKSPIAEVSFTNGIVVNAEKMNPGELVMYPLLLKKDLEQQKVICNTMLHYIVEQISAKQQHLLGFLVHYAGSSEDDIVNSNMWDALQEAHTMKVLSSFCFHHKGQIGLLQKMCQEDNVRPELFRVLCVMQRLLLQDCYLNSAKSLHALY